MDADETGLDPSARENNIPFKPSDWPLPSPTANIEDKRAKRQSLRVRPDEYFENAEPPSPLKTSLRSESLRRVSEMSLFHIFSRPKVERRRGYAEKGVDVPPPPQSTTMTVSASTPNLLVQVEPPINESPTQSSLPLQTNRSKASKGKFKEATPRDPAERRHGIFEPPPLFQAYPQSMKEGILEVSDLTPEAALRQIKSRKSKGDAEQNFEENQSQKNKKSGKSSMKHAGHGADLNGELPRKMFVLCTSGYLLQYAENGPSDRLPERMLHLGKDSAAFACDLVPEKHFVLQVSQAVDQEGVIIANQSSIFSKLGIRSAASRRMTSGYLLVMPDAAEFQSWMMAIRQEIETLGGPRLNSDAAIVPKTESVGTELKKTPSQSHRYQVKRHPNGVTNVTSPGRSSAMSSPTSAVFRIPSPTHSAFVVPSPTLAAFSAPSPARSPKIEEEKENSDTATIDDIDMEASKLEVDVPQTSPQKSPRKRTTSDAPSIGSSEAVSVEQQQLNSIRNSLSNSTRTSHTSQAGTVATAGGTSRTNSLVGSPPSPGFLAGTLESTRDSVAPLKPQYRPMASATFSANRRRSAVPLPTPREGQPLAASNASPVKLKETVIEESTATDKFPPPPKIGPPPSRLITAQSEPNLRTLTNIQEKPDSKPTSPPSVAPAQARPQSFIGDLPPPATRSSARGLSRRTSLMQTPPTESSMPRPDPPRAAESSRAKRMSFSMPLKINPSTSNSHAPPANDRRRSQLGAPDPAGELPIVHTLTAKVDGTKRVSISQYQPPLSLPPQNGQLNATKRASLSQSPSSRPPSIVHPNGLQQPASGAPSQRLSIFPNHMSSPPVAPPEPPKRSSSAMAQTSYTQTNGQPTPTLRRPTSMQVNSDHAPFLQSVRNSTGPPDARAIPIRGMKPSRSASSVATLATLHQHLPSTSPAPASAPSKNSFNGVDSTLASDSRAAEEETDKPTPLPDLDRAISPSPTARPSSRNTGRKLNTRSSLPHLDLGIPVVGLGPPAPPPSAPLPAPPPGASPAASPPISRTTSPSPVGVRSGGGVGPGAGGIDAVAGLGIQVS